MKQNNAKPSQMDLSSINEQSNTQSDVELEQIDMLKMNFFEYYNTNNVVVAQSSQFDGEQYTRDLIDRLIKKVISKAQENELMRKIPAVTATNSLDLIVLPLVQKYNKHEDTTQDIQTGGLEEDEEPFHIRQDQWLSAKINMEFREQRPETRQVSTAMTYGRSKLLDQTGQITQKKQLDPMPIDLVDPLDISATEEQLRNEKERQIKEKHELNELEKRRKLKEEKEEQLKYEMMAKDKKTKQFTYDYDGKLLSINPDKRKLPQPASTLGSKFEEDVTAKVQTKKKIGKLNYSNPIKKNDDEKEKDKETFKFNQLAPLVVENMNLQPGIVVVQDGRIKEGIRPSTVDLQNMTNPNLKMARNEYLSLTQQINSSLQQQNLTVKAEEKPIKEIDKSKAFNYDRLKRLHQATSTQQGQIKINSTKIFEQLASHLFEEEELPKIQQQTGKSSSEATMKGTKSPMDQFNLSLYKNTAWGKDIQSNYAINYEKLKTEKTRDRDLKSSIGSRSNRPRERKVLDNNSTLPTVRSQKNY